MPSKPYGKSLMLDFMMRRAETLHPTSPITIMLDRQGEYDLDPWAPYLVAASSWKTVGTLISEAPIHLSVLFGCFSRWSMLKNLNLTDESLPAMVKFDECPFLRLETLTLTGSECWPVESWPASFSSLTSLRELCLHVNVLPDPAFDTEDALERNLDFIATKLPKQLPLSRILFYSASGVRDILCVAISSRASLEIVLELSTHLPPPAAAAQNPIFVACCFLKTDLDCCNYVAALVKVGYSVLLATGIYEDDTMHAVVVASARHFPSTLSLLLSELPSDYWASQLLYTSLGYTPLSVHLLERQNDVLGLLDTHKLEVDVNMVSHIGTTAFFESVRSSLFHDAETLYKRGADPFLLKNISELAEEDISAWRNYLANHQIATFEDWFPRYLSMHDHMDGYAFHLADFIRRNAEEEGPQMWAMLETLSSHAKLSILECWSPDDGFHEKSMAWINQATTEELQKHNMMVTALAALDPKPAPGIAMIEKLFEKGLTFESSFLGQSCFADMSHCSAYMLQTLFRQPHAFSPEWSAFILGRCLPLSELLQAIQICYQKAGIQSQAVCILRTVSDHSVHWGEALCLGHFCAHDNDIDTFEPTESLWSDLEDLAAALRSHSSIEFDPCYMENFFDWDDEEWLNEKVCGLICVLCPTIFCTLSRRNLVGPAASLPGLVAAAKATKFPQIALQGLFVTECVTSSASVDVPDRLQWYFEQGLQLDFIPSGCGESSVLQICCESIDDATTYRCLRVFLDRLGTESSPQVASIVGHQDWFGRTALHGCVRIALMERHQESRSFFRVVRQLIRLGASPTVADVLGEAPVSYSASTPYFQQKPRIVALLQDVAASGSSDQLNLPDSDEPDSPTVEKSHFSDSENGSEDNGNSDGDDDERELSESDKDV
jgi:hypothetical protein